MYRGWFVVGAAMLAYMLITGSTYSAFGLFVLPVSDSFRLSRADMNTTLILLSAGNALLAPFVGRLLDKVPARAIMAGSALLYGLSFVTLGLSHSLALNAGVVAIPLALGMLGAGMLTMPTLVARWFTAQRGRALVLAAIGMCLGGLLVSPALGWLIHARGWREALVTAGVVGGSVLLLLAAFVPERPRADETEPHAGTTTASGPPPPLGAPLRIGAILSQAQFWTIALSVAMTMGMSQAVLISFVPLALENGLTLVQATSLVSITAGAAIFGGLIVSALADRVGRVTLLASLFAACGAVHVLLFLSDGYAMLLLCAFLTGAVSAALSPLYAALLADRFGLASFGTVRGLVAPVTAIGSAIALRSAGEVYDRTGGYALLFLIFAACQVVAVLLMLATRFTQRRAAQPLAVA